MKVKFNIFDNKENVVFSEILSFDNESHQVFVDTVCGKCGHKERAVIQLLGVE